MNDMDMRMTPGLELTNNMCEPSYPQKFVHAENPNKPGPTNHAAKQVNAATVMDMVWK